MKLFISLLAALVIVGHAQDDAASPDKKGIDDFQELEERDLLDEEARKLEENERQLSDDGIQGFKRQIDDGQLTNMAARQHDDGQPTNAEAKQIDDGQLTNAEARQLAGITTSNPAVDNRWWTTRRWLPGTRRPPYYRPTYWGSPWWRARYRRVVKCKTYCRRRGFRSGRCSRSRRKFCSKLSCSCYNKA